MTASRSGGAPRDADRHAVAGHPAAFHDGAAHVIRWANEPFLELFGPGVVGLPAREALAGLDSAGFELMDRVLREGRPLARRVGAPGASCASWPSRAGTSRPARSTA
ncbi:MAG: hypothetical protein U0838_11200 [Chloroflexota bacterium]